jgi:hypothetical protein
MQTDRRDITTLTIDPDNARAHPQRNIDAITESLRVFGQMKPIVVDSDGKILAGNGTALAATRLGWSTLLVVVSELGGMDAVAYALSDNRTGELSGWDADTVAKTLRRLIDDGIDVGAFGWTTRELELMIEGTDDDDDDDDDVPRSTCTVKVLGVSRKDRDAVIECLTTALAGSGLDYEPRAF